MRENFQARDPSGGRRFLRIERASGKTLAKKLCALCAFFASFAVKDSELNREGRKEGAKSAKKVLAADERVAVGARAEARGLSEGFGEVAGTHVADARADFGDGEVCLGQKRLRARGAQRGEVGVRGRARQFFEEAREVEGREVRGVGDLFEREVALHVRVHQLDGEAYASG